MVIYEYRTEVWGARRYRTRCSYCRSQFSSVGRMPLFNYMRTHYQICGPPGEFERRQAIRHALLERQQQESNEAWNRFFEGTV